MDFAVDGMDEKVTVFTTRPDTLYGATFLVLAPEHPSVDKLTKPEQAEAVNGYVAAAKNKSNVDRMQDKEKHGAFTGSYAVNPLNGKKLPIWISDYVLADHGTGAIMCVPAHDSRDFDFAKKFGLPIIQVIAKDGKEVSDLQEAYTETEGVMIHSGEWDGMDAKKCKEEAPAVIEQRGLGRKKVNYKLRDWVFSRQRYWGEPIPIVHCKVCGAVAVPEEELPLLLPDVEKYEPTGTGESPLAAIESFVNCKCPKCGRDARRETNTMPQWAGSSWYFLRYVDVHNDRELVSREKADRYLPVDMYIGGVEHAVLHLLYSRFWTKFLYDIGVIGFDEPFLKLFNQGMITGKNGIKMSKSKGNVVSPDDLIRDYGCDALRLYEMFVGPPELDSEWDERGIDGVYRFLTRFWRLDLSTKGGVDHETLKVFVQLLAPFAPHISEELWQRLGEKESVFHSEWPVASEEAMKEEEVEVVVQVNGKRKATILISVEDTKDLVLAKAREALGERLTGNLVKEIYVPGKIVNFVVKP